ncbi:MAG: hypothetical protein JWN93_3684 [Hyphomicrobiales bacterium]|nr:hypothetical protein [Hyphomicrobiales bacterium]
MTDPYVAAVETVSVTRRSAPHTQGFRMGPSLAEGSDERWTGQALQRSAQSLMEDAARRLRTQPVAAVGLAMMLGFLIGSAIRR